MSDTLFPMKSNNVLHSREASLLSASKGNSLSTVLCSAPCRHLSVCDVLQREEVHDPRIDILYGASCIGVVNVLFPGNVMLLHKVLDKLQSGLAFGHELGNYNRLAYLLGDLAEPCLHQL